MSRVDLSKAINKKILVAERCSGWQHAGYPSAGNAERARAITA